MPKEEIDVQAERAKFMADREKKIDAERAKNQTVEERAEYGNGFNNPPAVRGTDGGEPGTKERNAIEVAAEADTSGETDKGDEYEAVTAKSTVAQIKAYLDEQGIEYDPKASKPDLVKLLPAE